MLMIIPLSILSQSQQKDIERKGSKWIISNDAAQAFHYSEVERDSLIKEIFELRVRIDSLEKDRVKIIKLALKATNNIEEQVKKTIEFNKKQISTQKEISKYWRNLYRGIHLHSFMTQTNLIDFEHKNFQGGVELQKALSKRVILNFRPTFQNNLKPVYTMQLNYRIF